MSKNKRGGTRVALVGRRRSEELRTNGRGEEDGRVVARASQVQHAADIASRCVERTRAEPLAAEPVVFDELDDRRLRDLRVVNKVLLCPRRNHKERRPCTRTTTAVDRTAVDAKRLRCARRRTLALARQLVGAREGCRA